MDTALKTRRQNLILDPILDDLKQQVDYEQITICRLYGDTLKLILYRGPLPQSQALSINFGNIGTEHMGQSFCQIVNFGSGEIGQMQNLVRDKFDVLPKRKQISSRIVVQILSDNNLRMRITLSHSLPDHYSSDDARLVESIFSDNLLHLETGVLLSDERQRSDELKSLFKIQKELIELLDEKKVLSSVVSKVKLLTYANNSYIFLLKNNKYILKAKDELENSAINVNDCFLRENIFNVSENAIFRHGLHEKPFSTQSLTDLSAYQSHLIAPILFQGEVSGFILVTDKDIGIFGKSDFILMNRLASLASSALQNAQIYKMAQHMAVLEERDRLSRELHDELLQRLSYFKMETDVIKQNLRNEYLDKAVNHVNLLETAVDETCLNVREVIFDLREELLPRQDFLHSLERFLENYQDFCGLRVNLINQVSKMPDLIENEVVQISRIIQEALKNVQKHAKAKTIEVILANDENGFKILIRDDGIGFKIQHLDNGLSHFGLKIMKERAISMGGVLKIESEPDNGTDIILWTRSGGNNDLI